MPETRLRLERGKNALKSAENCQKPEKPGLKGILKGRINDSSEAADFLGFRRFHLSVPAFFDALSERHAGEFLTFIFNIENGDPQ